MKVALGAGGACIKTPWAQPRKKTSRARPREQFVQLVASVAFVSALRSPRFTFEPTAPWSQSVQFQPLVVSPHARSLIFNPAVAQRGHHAAAVDALEAAARHRGGDPGCSPSGWVLPLRRRLFFVIFGPPCCFLSLFDLFSRAVACWAAYMCAWLVVVSCFVAGFPAKFLPFPPFPAHVFPTYSSK